MPHAVGIFICISLLSKEDVAGYKFEKLYFENIVYDKTILAII
jgi:hypothetical protein